MFILIFKLVFLWVVSFIVFVTFERVLFRLYTSTVVPYLIIHLNITYQNKYVFLFACPCFKFSVLSRPHVRWMTGARWYVPEAEPALSWLDCTHSARTVVGPHVRQSTSTSWRTGAGSKAWLAYDVRKHIVSTVKVSSIKN